jgi:hypothetical protein
VAIRRAADPADILPSRWIFRSTTTSRRSDYSSGVLHGVIVDLSPDGQYAGHLLTTG